MSEEAQAPESAAQPQSTDNAPETSVPAPDKEMPEDTVMADAPIDSNDAVTAEKTEAPVDTSAGKVEAQASEQDEEPSAAAAEQAGALPAQESESAKPADAPVATTDMPTAIANPAEAAAPEDSAAKSLDNPIEIQAATASTTGSASKNVSVPVSRAASVVNGGADPLADEVSKAPVREYLQERVADWLLHGMKWLAVHKPDQPLLVLGQYLELAHYWRTASPSSGSRVPSEFESVWLRFRKWQTVPENKTKPVSDFAL